MRVAIVENTRVTHHGQIGVALHEAAARIGLYRPWADGVLPDMAEYDALVVFGGEQSALADASHPYLPDLAARMARTAADGKAVMGVCLGSQLLARGLGAENRLGIAPEFGWCEVALTEAGRADPVLGARGAAFPIFQWHSDTFTLPPGATRLAGSEVAEVQGFRYGRAGYAMQFHFEASRAVATDWKRSFPEVIDRLAPGWRDRFEAEAAGPGAAADTHGLAIARNWVALIEG